ncbi:MAG TPA: malate synthase G [Acidimicrobiales bacterium]|nr:malate synthase G [Acidimicrobiales bacterium]
MRERISVEGMQIDADFYRFLKDEALPGSGVDADRFWRGLSSVLHDMSGRNRELLARRDKLQTDIDAWHREHRESPWQIPEYRAFLEQIGYLEPECLDTQISVVGVDAEIATIAGPQLLVPVMNARYALNAANARWGSLYDALYGSDALGVLATPGPYDPAQGDRVIAWVREFLDDVVPLSAGSHRDVTAYMVVDGALRVDLVGGGTSFLGDPTSFAGFQGEPATPSSILLRHHGLHIEIVVDRSNEVGRTDLAGVADVVLESAVTVIIDCEDSVAAVDAADKIVVYRNWLGLMKGDLEETLTKDGRTFTRRLAMDRTFKSPDGSPLTLPGRALLLIRNVGHLMTTDAVLDTDGNEVPEGLLDAMITVLAAMHNLQRPTKDQNSRHQSIYVVKPKMHGSAEVAFASDVFGHVEDALGLPRDTIKIGLMDEERRTSLNLGQCISAVPSRIVFINTGFLDRTGDEIHTSMEAGVMVPKGEMRDQQWFDAYEDRNVDIGLAYGFRDHAQIGKGMWAAPDLMAKMLAEKIAHPLAGANCAWVPSPTAATLHATHYHRVDVRERQDQLASRRRRTVDEMLKIPLATTSLSDADVAKELENNAQGILGYAVRWIDQGIGCSKVPDIHDVALMEDRATCRISSQHIANWLRHGVVDREQVMSTMRRMAAKVDEQNEDDPNYTPMAPDFDGVAFKAACDLVLSGTTQPSGYTEPILHARRREYKRWSDERA